MEIINVKKICKILLIVGLFIIISPNVFPQGLTYDSLNNASSVNEDFLVNQTIQVWFGEILNFSTLSPNTTFESAKSDALSMGFTIGNKYFTIISDNGSFKPLDTITVTLGSGVADTRGNTLGTPQTFDILIGPVVYPGDTDNNGVVDERDILPLGIFWQYSGPVRPDNPNLIWRMQPTYSWTALRATYVDADGNGIVEAHDICGIANNFDRTKIAFTPEKDDILIPFLKQGDRKFATQIYAALIDCSNKSTGQQVLLDILEPIVNQSPATMLPDDFTMNQNYPNPFNPSTTIEFYLPKESQVTLSVYNITGQLVITLIDQKMPSGYSEVVWDGQDNNNNNVSSGIYFYRLDAGDKTFTKRMLLLK